MIDARYYHVDGPFSLKDLLAGSDVRIPEGKKLLGKVITAPAPLARSQPGHISFLSGRAYRKDIETAQATACLVIQDLAEAIGAARIMPLVTARPRTVFAKVIARFATPKLWDTEGIRPDVASAARLHPTVVIGSGVHIEADVHIGPGTYIGPGVQIGVGTHIGANVSIQAARIGQNCRIKSGAVIGSEGFG
ncbi:MAG: hypothetical protein GDA39_06495, partial [Hyphomonadaceae bacterium]|nr:hypothetical protein [Hyphomonadaceae bacterium]